LSGIQISSQGARPRPGPAHGVQRRDTEADERSSGPPSGHSSAPEEMEHDHDDGDDEEEVNQTAGDVEGEETESPQHEQNQSDG
jgi:hypothetical protein